MSRNEQDVDTEFKVTPIMHMDNSRDPLQKRPGVDDKLPIAEKYITNIPQQDDTAIRHLNSKSHTFPDENISDDTQKESLKQKLKKHLPGHNNSPETRIKPEQQNITEMTKHQSGSSAFEIVGLMPMTTQGSSESASGGVSSRKPNLERHISSIPEKDDDLDGEEERGCIMSGKLRREISRIEQDD